MVLELEKGTSALHPNRAAGVTPKGETEVESVKHFNILTVQKGLSEFPPQEGETT